MFFYMNPIVKKNCFFYLSKFFLKDLFFRSHFFDACEKTPINCEHHFLLFALMLTQSQNDWVPDKRLSCDTHLEK